jgi:hypothetical protein
MLSAPFLLHTFPVETAAQSGTPSAVHHQNAPTLPSGPDCSGGWPTNMAQALLQNAGMMGSNKIDFSKSKTIRLASQKIGKNLYHQVYDVVFVEYSGRKIQAIAVHDTPTKNGR